MTLSHVIAGLIIPLCPVLCLGQANEGGLDQGKAIFRSNCAFCHGLTAQGGRGPNLISSALLRSSSDDAIKAVIKGGVSGTTMPAFDFPKDDLDSLIQFLHSLAGSQSESKVPGDAA